ncbi:3-hydroxyisobutyryl-CoA hydrolase [Frankia sp. R43]|uniref:enoyl-CoA hydratase/isomerase family protein n=1 Tax=Frankia sp. R43 TaxID=269536 RepID=UPI0006CA01FA|nr:enoyl-CoA hydratase/isomerase family protein [Frankia sp. R43]KPM55441.1 3-hydroxyisobutyryl-CoA hydrolase [Frankia sp. R43]
MTPATVPDAVPAGGGELLRSVQGRVGRLTLNRPKAINALNHAMVRAMDAALREWEHDDQVDAVLVDGAGERGLCAGGDIRSIYEDARTGGTGTLDFWADEYRLNARIAGYPKPYVVLMDGLVMGGGVGISAHGNVRVVTERTRLGMPEVGIGFVPDVGGTWLLARMPGESGTHVALTTGQLSGADAVHAGLADHVVPSERLPDLVEAFVAAADATNPAKILESFTATASATTASSLAAAADWIDSCYGARSVETIIARLRAHGSPGAAAAADAIAGKSPSALKATLRALRTAADLPDLWATLVVEFRVSSASLRSHDLREGIRAQIIDKDRNPRWNPPTLDAVGEEAVAAYFAVPAAGDLAPAGDLTSAEQGESA